MRCFEEARGRRCRGVSARVSSGQLPRVSDVPRDPISEVRFDVEIPRGKFIERTANTGLQRRSCTSIAPERPDESTRLELPTFYKNARGAPAPGMCGLAGDSAQTLTANQPVAAAGTTARKRRDRSWFGPSPLQEIGRMRSCGHGASRQMGRPVPIRDVAGTRIATCTGKRRRDKLAPSLSKKCDHAKPDVRGRSSGFPETGRIETG